MTLFNTVGGNWLGQPYILGSICRKDTQNFCVTSTLTIQGAIDQVFYRNLNEQN